MAFPDELLAEAVRSVHSPAEESQGRYRRAVSTAYYALFHLLIGEATANWNRPEQREKLARAFEHKHMRRASDQVKGKPYANEDPDVVARLRQVAACFADLQQSRIEADYDRAKPWTHVRTLSKVRIVSIFVHELWEKENNLSA